jgi:hypothetical protein
MKTRTSILAAVRRAIDAPEFAVAGFSFLLHFVWEFIQVPAYGGMAETSHQVGVLVCSLATIGDVGIALAAFLAASAAARSRNWLLAPALGPFGLFLAVGLGLTVALEYYHTNISLRWSYSDLMPLIPPFGTGLFPLLQWVVIPPLVIWLAGRHIRGGTCSGAA